MFLIKIVSSHFAQLNSLNLEMSAVAAAAAAMPDHSSIVHIQDGLTIIPGCDDDMHEVPLSDDTVAGEHEADDEDDDHLTPLMMDNHTVLEHQETFKSITRLIDVADRIHEIVEFKPAAYKSQSPPPPPVVDSATHTIQRKNSQESSISDGSFDESPVHQRRQSGYMSSSSSDENAKDSGCDVTGNHTSGSDGNEQPTTQQRKKSSGDGDEDGVADDSTPIEIPDDDLAEKIVQQVEFYFSNENILKDAFLLKHVRRNKEGFVSLKLISSFKRVRQLTKDWRVVGYAIKLKSVNIEPNELGTKVRRLEPLPVFDETMPSRTVVATDLPVDKITIERVSDLFSKCGEIALIRILRPGGSIPTDVRQFYNKHPELHERECALVEFVESHSARAALELDGIQTFEMVAPKKKTGKKATSTSVSKIVENYKYPSYTESERSRGGGDGGADFKYHIRRNSSGFFVKNDMSNGGGGGQHVCQHLYRKPSYGQAPEGCEHFTPAGRRSSNCSIGSANDMMIRKYSNCSDGFCSSDASSRRPSMCSAGDSAIRRTSNCSQASSTPDSSVVPPSYRRSSNCSSEYCACSMRRHQPAQCDSYRRISQCSNGSEQPLLQRRFSATSNSLFERRTSVDSQGRRISFDNDFERKMSSGSFEMHRKLSNGFERKLSMGDKFYDSRKMSTDSGYDRRCSISSMASDYSGAPRSRTNSVITGTTSAVAPPPKAEILVRTPIGPDGSKGFGSRARKFGHVIGPV